MSRARLLSLRNIRRNGRGFTLVEMLVVAPMAVLSIAVLTSFMVNMLGDALVSHKRALGTYNLQESLDRIERDTRLTSAFLPSFSLLPAGQGRNASTSNTTDTTPFSTTNGDLILNQTATSTNPYFASRQIVYYAEQPNPCASAQKYTNRSLTIKVIYFTKDDGKGAGTTTLWRRSIVPTFDTNTGVNITGNSVCNAPWQRDTCPTLVPSADCKAYDEKIIENVSSFTTVYSNDTATGLTNTRLADTATVTITLSEKAAGKTVTSTGKVRAERINESLDEIPQSITDLEIKNPQVNAYNHPLLTTFTWAPSQYASVYKVWYQLNGGAVTTKVITDNSIGVPSRPLDNIKIGVTALNDMGESAEVTYNGTAGYNKPLWTPCSLQNGWQYYGWPYETPGYTITTAGLVVFKGLIAGTSGWAQICSIPTQFAPAKTQIFSVTTARAGQGGPGRIDVVSDGNIQPQGVTPSWVSLADISYIPQGTAMTWTNATLLNGWTNWDTGWWQGLRYGADSAGRTHVNGLLRIGTTPDNTPIATLPSSLRPSQIHHIPSHADRTDEMAGNGFNPVSGAIVAKGHTGYNYMSIQDIFFPSTYANWTNIALQNSWTVLAGYTTPQYTKAADGLVSLKGLIRNTGYSGRCPAGQVIANLPAGYRPKERHIYMVASNFLGGDYARVDVDFTGDVMCMSGFGAWTSLDSIRFIAEQ